MNILVCLVLFAPAAATDISIGAMTKNEFQVEFAPILVDALNELSAAKAKAAAAQERLAKLSGLKRKGHASIQEVKKAEIDAANTKTRFEMRRSYFRICETIHKNLTDPIGKLPFRTVIQVPGNSVDYGGVLLFDAKQANQNLDVAFVQVTLPDFDWKISAWPSRRTIELCYPAALARNEAKVNGTIKLAEMLVTYREHRVKVKQQAFSQKVLSEFELNHAKLDLAVAKAQLVTERKKLKIVRFQREQLEALGKQYQADFSSSIPDLPVSISGIEKYVTDQIEQVASYPSLAYGYLRTARAWLVATESYHTSHRKAVSSRERRNQIFAIKSASANERMRVDYWAALTALHTQQEAQTVRLRSLEFIQWLRAAEMLKQGAEKDMAGGFPKEVDVKPG